MDTESSVRSAKNEKEFDFNLQASQSWKGYKQLNSWKKGQIR